MLCHVLYIRSCHVMLKLRGRNAPFYECQTFIWQTNSEKAKRLLDAAKACVDVKKM